MTELEHVVTNSVRLSAQTKQVYCRTARRFTAFAGESSSNWTSKAVNDFLLHISASVSSRSLAAYIAHLKYMSKRLHLESGGSIPDFAAYLEAPKHPTDRQLVRSLTHEEVERVLEACSGRGAEDRRNRAIFGVALTTGMRRHSLYHLDISDISQKDAVIKILLKGGGNFLVPLREDCWDHLKPWMTLLETLGCTSGPLFRPVRPEVSPSKRLAYDSYADLCKAFGVRVKIPNLHMHVFRHTFITRAKELGWSDLEIAAMTGHVTDLKGYSSVISGVYTDLQAVAKRHPKIEQRLW